VTQPAVRYRTFIMDSARWEDVPLHDGDIIISAPAKCGTTWMQTICALLIFQTSQLPRPLDELSIWVDMLLRSREDLASAVTGMRHRRFLKTHTPLDGLPFDERVTYVCVGRDPRDTAISWDNHVANCDFEVLRGLRVAAVGTEGLDRLPAPGAPPESPRDRFWAWADTDDLVIGLPAMLRHLTGFWQVRDRPNVVLVHYDDLKADLAGQMRRLAGRLGLDVPERRWPELVRAAGFDSMRGNATQLAPDVKTWRDPDRFFHRGTSGQWRDLLDADDLRRYADRVAAIADPDLAAWAHQGAPLT
jgi:hypothetical protein